MLRSVFDTLSFRSHSFQRSQYFFDFLPIQNPLSPTLCKHYSSGESLIWDTLLSTSWTMLHPFVKKLPIAASRACPLCYIYIYEINYFRMRGWARLTVFSEPPCASNQTKTRNYLLLLFFLCRELPRIRDLLAIEASGFELGDRLSSVHIENWWTLNVNAWSLCVWLISRSNAFHVFHAFIRQRMLGNCGVFWILLILACRICFDLPIFSNQNQTACGC